MSDQWWCANCGYQVGNVHGDCDLCGLMLVRPLPHQAPPTGIEKYYLEQEKCND